MGPDFLKTAVGSGMVTIMFGNEGEHVHVTIVERENLEIRILSESDCRQLCPDSRHFSYPSECLDFFIQRIMIVSMKLSVGHGEATKGPGQHITCCQAAFDPEPRLRERWMS